MKEAICNHRYLAAAWSSHQSDSDSLMGDSGAKLRHKSAMTSSSIIEATSHRSRALEASKIRAIAEMSMGREGIIPLWFGEGAWQTNPIIVDAAVASLRAGNHKYQPNNGARDLREAICAYSNALYGCALAPERITVTPSGMQGLMLAAELLVTPGDRVVMIEPSWPNIVGCFTTQGAQIERLCLAPKDGSWWLDMDALLAALTAETRVLVINSPNNPTGWTMSAADQKIVLDHCRQNDIWIVADDVYTRLYRHGRRAPSFLELSRPDDLFVSVNSFSKCWSMTGWRLGWLVAPPVLEAKLGQLTEFNTSCTAGFVQDAGIAALRHGEDEIADLRKRIGAGYGITADRLARFPRVEFVEPDGAFYCFFRVEGLHDSFSAAMEILEKTGVGLAPGIAFGESGEGYLRLCYAQPEDVLATAFDRLAPFLSTG